MATKYLRDANGNYLRDASGKLLAVSINNSNAPIPIFLQGVLNGESSETGPSIRDLLGGSECYAIGVLTFESESGEGSVCGSDGDSHWMDIVDDTYQVTIAPNLFMLHTVATRMSTRSTDLYPWEGTTIRGYINILGSAFD